MPAVSARGRLKQEDHEFEVTLGYSLSIADNTLCFCFPRAEERKGVKEELGPGI